jgi:hypothetical protein
VTPRPAAAAPTRRQWLILFLLFLSSLPAVTARLYSSDEIQYFAYLRSLWFDRDLSFDNEYQHFYDLGIGASEGFHQTFLELTTETGHRINFGTIGCAILWSPFYGVGDLLARAAGAPRDGYSKPYVAAVAYGSAVYGFLALVLAVLCARELEMNGFGAALCVWAGTPLLFYMYVAPPFSHGCSAFAVALFTYVWLRARAAWTTRGFVALAAAGALMAMVREQDAFFIAGATVDFLLWVFARDPWTRVKSTIPGILASATTFPIVFAPQAISYIVLNGHLGPSRLVMRKMYWTAPHAWQVLFSPAHGFFWWTPLALVAIAGVVWLASTSRAGLALLVMIALQIYIGGSVDSWTVAGGFGQRRFVALTAAMVIGLSFLLARIRRPGSRVAVGAIVAVCVYWNIALVAEFGTRLMNHEGLEPARNAYDAFVTLPRQVPSLTYRYFFERSSFYQRARDHS